MAADRLTRESDVSRDTFIGALESLMRAGIITEQHLPPQPGRKKNYAMFMPDGSPVPPGACGSFWTLPGFMQVRALSDGRYRVEVSVSREEQERRREAEPAYTWGGVHNTHYRGSEGQLRRAGIPPAWLRGLPEPGKRRGKRTIREDERRITISVGEQRRFYVVVDHIDYYRQFGPDRYAQQRREWGLPEQPEIPDGTYTKIVQGDEIDEDDLTDAVRIKAREAVAADRRGKRDSAYVSFMLRVLEQPGRSPGA